MLIRKPFDYEPLQRIDTERGRRYLVVGSRPLPSVTTILSKTKDMTHLNEWTANVGEEEANRIKNEASALGGSMHKNLENYILGETMSGTLMAKALAKVIIKNGFVKINEIWGSEVSLFSKDLYAGTADLVGVFDNKSAIMDFKNSLNDKKKEWIDDYAAQLAAYALAHNEMYGTNIRRGVVMVATREAKYQEFIFEDAEFDRATGLWLSALEKYYKLYGEDK